jgi:hypothetical protein
MNKKQPSKLPTTAAPNAEVPHAKFLPRIETILTIPDVPNPWIFNGPQQELQKRKKQTCHEATLASMTQQLAQLLGECQNLPPCISTKPPERDYCDIIPQPSFDWPSSPVPSFCQELKLSQPLLTFQICGSSTFPNKNHKNKTNKHIAKQN